MGLDEDYVAILPAIDPKTDTKAPPLEPPLAAALREALIGALAVQTGKRTLAKDERVLIGPYPDPLLGVPVVTAFSIYYVGDTPTVLIAMTIPADTFLAGLHGPPNSGTLLLVSAQHRPIMSSPPLSASTEQAMRDAAARTPAGGIHYTLGGAMFVDAVKPGYSLLVSYMSWGAVIAALRWQLGAIIGLGLLLIAAIALTARFWGMRLLRRWHEEAARALESETINHIVVSATPVGLCIVRQRDFSILTSNQLAHELLHLDHAKSLPAHIAAAYTERSLHAPAAAQSANIAEFLVPALPGQTDAPDPQMLQISYAAARYAGEDVFFCAILDITVRHALGRQLRAAQRETEAMMRAQSHFFAAMSHEIRTPMNALLGNLELLSRSPGLEQHQQRVRAVGMAADGLRRIVNDILDFSKIDAGKMQLVTETFKPIDDLENLALSYAPLADNRPLRFYAHLSPSLYQPLCGDRARVVQIVNNLLSNAFKFTSSGKIMLGAHVQVDARGRHVLTCRVSDSGIGMDAALVARIFNPFVQAESSTPSRFGGTGLGLSICARLCELMSGQISVESVPGVGTAFTVALPLDKPADERSAPPQPAPPRGNAFVLCQEAESAGLLGELLTLGGWLTTSVTSLGAAEAWLRVNRPVFMIVTGEYDADAIAALRALRPVTVVWTTRTGPQRPAVRGDGVLEVTEFSHAAVVAAIELAASGAPPDEPPLDEVSEASAPTSDPALRGLRVLVAEDNPLNQALITEQLTTLGCIPIVVGDGRQALAVLSQTPVDLVLTDMHMPIMDGYALMAALREAHPALPVLAYSAVTGAEQTEEWRQRGFTDYIPKPASLKQLETGLLALGLRAAPLEETAPPAYATEDTLGAADRDRYMAMLKDHLSTDLPKLAGIVEARDREALRNWAHSAAGAFLIVREPEFAAQCRELQHMCDAAGTWTPGIAACAVAVHDGLRSHFGLDEASLH